MVVDLKNIALATPEDKLYNIDKWAQLFKAQTWEEIKMLAATSSVIDDAATTLYQLSEDERIRQECEAREDYWKREQGLIDEMSEMQKRLAEKDETIAEKDETIAEKDEALIKQQETIAEKDEAIIKQQEALAEKDEALIKQQEALAAKDEEIAKLKAMLARTN